MIPGARVGGEPALGLALTASLVVHLVAGGVLWWSAQGQPAVGHLDRPLTVWMVSPRDLGGEGLTGDLQNVPTATVSLNGDARQRPRPPERPTGLQRAGEPDLPQGSGQSGRPPIDRPPSPGPTTAPAAPSPLSLGAVVPGTPALLQVPEVVLAPDLRYPAEALTDGRNGSVDARVFLARDGTVVGVQVLASTPPGLFDTATARAFYAARFAPLADGEGGPDDPGTIVHVDVHVDYQVPPDGEAVGAPSGR